MTTGLFIGRFQPFHRGHLAAIKYIEKKVDKLIIGIAVHPCDSDNPFSSRLRKKMIQKSGVKHQIAFVRDTKSDEDWSGMVMRRFKPDIVFSNNPWTKECFKGKAGVVRIPVEVEIGATQIRKMMRSGRGWKDFVPKGTIEVLDNA